MASILLHLVGMDCTYKVAAESKAIIAGSPDALEGADELVGASVALGVLQPPLPDARKFAFVPAGDNVHGDASVGVVVNTGKLLRCDGRIPRPGKYSSNKFEALGVVQQRLRKGNTLVLVIGSIRCGEADLSKCILEPVFFSCLSISHIGFQIPARFLCYFRDDKAA